MRPTSLHSFDTLERRILALLEMCGLAPGVCVLLLDRDLLVLEAGEGLRRLAGRAPEEFAGRPVEHLFAPPGLRRLEAGLEEAGSREAGVECLLEVLGPADRKVPVRAVAGAAPDPPGSILLVLISSVQACPAPPAPEAAAPVSPFLEIFGAAEGPALLVTKTGTVLEANRSAREWAGEFSSRGSVFELVAAEDLLSFGGRLRRAASEGRSFSAPLLLRPADPREPPRPAEALFLPLDLPPGRGILFLLPPTIPSAAPSRPAPRPPVATPALTWIAGACHDLQTPLVAARGYAQMLLAGKLGGVSTEQGEALERIRRAIDRTSSLARSLDALARAGGGEPLAAVPVDFATALTEAWDLLRDRARAGQVRLELDPGPEAVRLLADPGLLGRVLDNLLGNAVKFNQRGGLVSAAWARLPGHRLRFEIANTGLSVRPEDRERIFEPFQRGRNTQEVPGHGLGLAVARAIVERHGGSIRPEERQGGGARFVIEWPLAE